MNYNAKAKYISISLLRVEDNLILSQPLFSWVSLDCLPDNNERRSPNTLLSDAQSRLDNEIFIIRQWVAIIE